MVEIRIWVEGAVLQHEKHSVQMMDNSHRFREGFRKLFSKAYDEQDLQIIIENGSGISQTVNFFKQRIDTSDGILLLIDLEGSKSEKEIRLNQFKLLDFRQNVFFMVQAMEAWILSQPDKIEQYFSKFRHGNTPIYDDNNLLGIHPEDIRYPDRVLNTILSRYFREVKNGKTKKLKYHGNKLKSAPDLIELLNFEELKSKFEDAEKLHQKILDLVAHSPSSE